MEQQSQIDVNQVPNSSSNQKAYPYIPNATFSNKKLEHMNCLFQGDYQIGGLYIGDVISTIKPGVLESGNIKAILGCSYDQNLFNNKARTDIKLDTAIIDCKDSVEYPISMHFGTAYDFIQNHRKNKKSVLVHCHAGVSRSCAIIISYLIKKLGWSALQSYKFIKSKRERVKPNLNFWKQLVEYEKQFVPKQRWSKISQSQFEPPRPPVQQKINNQYVIDDNKKIAPNKMYPILNNLQLNPQINSNYRQNNLGQKYQEKRYYSPTKPPTQFTDSVLTPQLKHINYITSPRNVMNPSTFYWSPPNQFAPKEPIYYNTYGNDNKLGNQNNFVRSYDHPYSQLTSPKNQVYSQPNYQQRTFKFMSQKQSEKFIENRQQQKKP